MDDTTSQPLLAVDRPRPTKASGILAGTCVCFGAVSAWTAPRSSCTGAAALRSGSACVSAGVPTAGRTCRSRRTRTDARPSAGARAPLGGWTGRTCAGTRCTRTASAAGGAPADATSGEEPGQTSGHSRRSGGASPSCARSFRVPAGATTGGRPCRKTDSYMAARQSAFASERSAWTASETASCTQCTGGDHVWLNRVTKREKKKC